MTAVLPRNNLSKTASKTGAICVRFASTAARGCVRAASTLRPLCVCAHLQLRLRALAAGALRPVCVSAACGRSHKILFVDRRKISRFAFSLLNVGVGIRFHASDFNHLTRVSRIVTSGSSRKRFHKFSDVKAFPIRKEIE